MKRLLVLLVLLAGGLVAAALAVPTNAVVVNGSTISQQSLNADVSAIAGSAYYQCYLNSQAYISSSGSEQLPPIIGAGKTQDVGDHPTASTAFIATYLDTEVEIQLVQQLADQRHVTVTSAGLADARTSLSTEISDTMSEILQTSVAQNVRYSCSLTGQAVTGDQVLSSLPSSFVDEQVQFGATASALEEDLAGVGSSDAELQEYFAAHRSEFDTACWTAAEFSSEASAKAAAAEVAFGTPFSQVATASQGGPQQCVMLPIIASHFPSTAEIENLPTGTLSQPIAIDQNGDYVLLQITSRTPTDYATAKEVVAQVVQESGSTATQKAITAAERHARVSVDPRYGVWVPGVASVFAPLPPEPTDVLNAPANEPGVVSASAGAGSSSG